MLVVLLSQQQIRRRGAGEDRRGNGGRHTRGRRAIDGGEGHRFCLGEWHFESGI